MSITNNNYVQLHDYLSQIVAFPRSEDVPYISQRIIAEKLSVDQSGVCRFLEGSTKRPKKMLNNFNVKYSLEFQKWSRTANKLGRTLVETDVFYFLGMEQRIKIDKSISLQLDICPATSSSNVEELPLVKRSAKRSAEPLASLTNALELPPAKRFKRSAEPAAPSSTALELPPVNRISKRWTKPTVSTAPIVITYRGHNSDKDAQGMLFDHMRIQKICKVGTFTLFPEDEKISEVAQRHFMRALKNHTLQLPHCTEKDEHIFRPSFGTTCDHLGLIIIPGRVYALEDEPVRLEHEYKLIRSALNRGQPMLGICAGSWRIWEQLIIWTKFPDLLNETPSKLLDAHKKFSSLVDVTDHAYGGGMMRLGENTVTHNVEMHGVLIKGDSLLEMILKTKLEPISVNSVHGKAVNSKTTKFPENIQVSAWAKKNSSIRILSRTQLVPQSERAELESKIKKLERQIPSKYAAANRKLEQLKKRVATPQTFMDPQEDTVEAFESILGVPIMGIQWHPEGYSSGSQGEIPKYGALAGTAFTQKTQMHKQLKESFSKSPTPCSKIIRAAL